MSKSKSKSKSIEWNIKGWGIKIISLYIVGALLLLYVGAVIGYNSATVEKEQVQTELSKAQTAANSTTKEYEKLLSTHNDLVKKWNQEQKDINAGKYTRTQYIQGPTRYIPSYTPTYSAPIRCTTNYYSYLNSSSTTCY